jgi:cytidylate kinase
MKNNVPIITIDGPSSSGKGTISKLLAEKIGWNYLDSGAVYRALALLIIEDNINLDIDCFVKSACNDDLNNNKIISFIKNLNSEQIQLRLKDQLIRSEECGMMASKIAIIPEIRVAINAFLQEFNIAPGLVADGRDMGTIVFPSANLKLFLTASNEERAARRCLQLQKNGINVNFNAVLQSLIERDVRDQNREIAPLKPDQAAIIIDTTKLSIDEVLQLIMNNVYPLF